MRCHNLHICSHCSPPHVSAKMSDRSILQEMKGKTRFFSVVAALAAASAALTAPGTISNAQTGGKKNYLPLMYRDFPAPPTVFGIHYDFGPSGALTTTQFDRLTDTASSWTRLQPGLRWSLVEATEGTYDWSVVAPLEEQLRNLASRNVKISLVINQTPSWAQQIPNKYCGPVKPAKFARMGAFFAEAVKRYSVAPYNVEYFEFQNEPDAFYIDNGTEDRSLFGCWGNTSDAFFGGREYGAALKVAYQAAKQANPRIKFMVGGLLMDCDPAVKVAVSQANFSKAHCKP